jgi:hypothetical protein
VRPEWWREQGASFGPTLTPYGTVTVRIEPADDGAVVTLDGRWWGEAPPLELRLPGTRARWSTADRPESQLTIVPP